LPSNNLHNVLKIVKLRAAMALIFFSYSHRDEALRDELETHLTALKRQGLITLWHDLRIVAGEDWEHAISQQMRQADVILLLVSPDFIASNYCYDVELGEALERHRRGEAHVIPVILRPCDWQSFPFGRLQAVPANGRPVVKFPSLDEAFLEVTRAIKQALPAAGTSVPGGRSTPSSSPFTTQPIVQGPRSSNLRIRREFTEHERDSFGIQAFEYLAAYFENSLAELKTRNSGIETRFRRIDANSFESTVYRGGSRCCHCGVWITGGPYLRGQIVFGHSGVAAGSYNESLSIADDGTSLGLSAMGMSRMSRPDFQDKFLTLEGAAELYWSLFIEPLQR
jgi:hypothetical protein